MDLKQNLFWEKYRPNSLKYENGSLPIILLPRIKKLVENGIKFNMIFHGSGGLGKTSLALILTKNYDTLKINCSLDNGIDTLRDVIYDHCNNFSISLNKNKRKSGNIYNDKVILLEEFDNSTPDFRKGLRGFIEEYSNVRFIATLNNIVKLKKSDEDKALLSRFNIINFEPQNNEEILYLKKHQLKYLKFICHDNNLEISDEILKNIIERNFPNFRSSIQELQEIILLKNYNLKNYNNNLNVDLYNFILDEENDVEKNFLFVTNNYPKEKSFELLNLLSRPFFKYLIDNKIDIINKNGFKILSLMKEYNYQYNLTIDPEIHLVDFITKLKMLMK